LNRGGVINDGREKEKFGRKNLGGAGFAD